MNATPWQQTHALASAIASGQITSLDAVELYLAQIARHNGTLNAVVTLDAESARARARDADQARERGESLGPLHGVPFTVKDTFCTRGMLTTAGVPELRAHVPDEDAAVVRKLKQAGAILLGKTNTPPMASQPQTDNPVFGRTNNPWNLERTPGGSSGGSAAAVAAALTPFDVGSDMSGSIRIPAHYCGVYGFKPTARRISTAGHIPEPPGSPRIERYLGTVGPITRSARDLALVASCLVGTDARDSEVAATSWRNVPSAHVRDLRIAVAPTFPNVPCARSIREAVEAASSRLMAAGAIVEERLPDRNFEQDRAVWQTFFNGFMHGLSGLSPVQFKPPQGATFTLVDWLRVLDQRDAVIRGWEAFFERWDVLLTPVVPALAPPHAPPGTAFDIDGVSVPSSRVDHFLYWFNFTGHPAAVLPAGLDASGLPIGIQCVGARWRDEELLASVHAIDEVLGGYQAPAGFR